MRLVLGVDTSNYTTSVCAISYENGAVVAEARRLLPVRQGERGLRQSEALFFHVRHLPALMDELMAGIARRPAGQADKDGAEWAAVGVSVRPRPWARSYMPVFWAGVSLAESMAQLWRIPLVRTSHQEGHIAAAWYHLTGGRLAPRLHEPFLAVHLSGGTSDVLWCTPTRFGYAIELIGAGADLHAGQFVDRVGVALGAPFPAGPWLESLAAQAQAEPSLRLKVSVREASMSFSGPCTAALRAIEQGIPASEVALAVQVCIADSVAKAVHRAWHGRPVGDVIIAGGVASNRYIRQRIRQQLAEAAPGLRVSFAEPRFSSDNALGPASIARHFLRSDWKMSGGAV
ncbi:MAG: peptidase M22 [Alicyclobacillaceae bacterium]|nr:peptidase M22 [Alicyclobacillaceae bacterium]